MTTDLVVGDLCEINGKAGLYLGIVRPTTLYVSQQKNFMLHVSGHQKEVDVTMNFMDVDSFVRIQFFEDKLSDPIVEDDLEFLGFYIDGKPFIYPRLKPNVYALYDDGLRLLSHSNLSPFDLPVR